MPLGATTRMLHENLQNFQYELQAGARKKQLQVLPPNVGGFKRTFSLGINV
jgi:hypothetical protein